MKSFYPFLLSLLLACSLVSEDKNVSNQVSSIKNGHWLFNLEIEGEKIPFNAFFSNKNNEDIFVVKNGDEVISITDLDIINDSLYLTMPIFGSRLEAHLDSDTSLSGEWYNTTKSNDYHIPFRGFWGIETRFKVDESLSASDFSGKWEVTFSPNEESPCKAIGIFNQTGNKLQGTFLTQTGDYRYLEGNINGNKLMLSCFDGAHAFLFKAEINSEEKISGLFWSGNHWSEEWVAVRNDSYSLPHPDSITYVVDDQNIFDLAFTDLNNKEYRLSNPLLKNKVVILQILGTWCPNCADETKDFSAYYSQYNDKGLEIVAISYERTSDFDLAKEKIEQFKNELGANYTFLFAGKASKKKSSEDFNMINGIFSYPTAIFIDRNGKIRKIHTGYYGPGTGKFHHKFQEETQMFIEKLLEETVSS